MSARRAILAMLALALGALPAVALAARAHHHRAHHHRRHHASARLERERRHPPHLTHRLPTAGAVTTTPAPPTGAPTGTPPTTTTTPAPPAGPARVQVLAREYSFQLSRQTLASGAAIVELDNAGQDPHALNIQRAGGGPLLTIDTVAAGTYERGRFDLPAGTYRLWCPLGDHDALGMHATIVVG